MKLLYQHEINYIKSRDPCFLKTSKSGQFAVNADQISDFRKQTDHFQDYEGDSRELLIICNNPWTEEEIPEYVFEPDRLYSKVLTIYDFWAYWKL